MTAIVPWDLFALIPLTFLGLSKWLTARLMFNRVDGSVLRPKGTQRRIVLLLLPIWGFVVWTGRLQIRTGDSWAAALSTLAQCTLNHYINLGVLNDSFMQSETQIWSLVLGIGTAYCWLATDLVMYSLTLSPGGGDHCNVTHVDD